MEKDASKVEADMPRRISYWKMIIDQGVTTPEIENWEYDGSGTEDDPYLVEWIDHDPRNPMLFPQWKKWFLTAMVAIATLAVAFVSSAYSGGVDQILREFGCSQEVVTLGISFFVLGFAVGPLLWAPLSELFGRQYLFIGTYAMLSFFNAGAAGSQNIATLLILRFFAGSFGSSPLTNAGGVIADMFPAKERGLALSFFAAAPFLGPVIGPIVGGFVGETIGWRWVEGVMAIFTGVLWIAGSCLIPETYPPVLLQKRAARLSKITGKVYVSKSEAQRGKTTIAHAFKTSLLRPWILLLREPIVLLLSIYMAIVYGTLYMLFAAFPIVYQEGRGWSEGVGGLAFLGVAVGMFLAVAYSVWDNGRYIRAEENSPDGFAPPEARLPPAMVGGIAIPIGLFWFAWTNDPSLPFMASIAAGVPFGFGMVLVFLAIMNYLIDAYVIFAASVLAANSVLRSLFGAAFPLFTTQMYNNLGIHWASSIPGFLALMCVPFPFLFYKFGPQIRARCKFAAEADRFLKQMRKGDAQDEQDEPTSDDDTTNADEKELKKENSPSERNLPTPELEKEREEGREQEAFDYSYEDELEQQQQPGGSKWQPLRTTTGGAVLTKKQTTASMRSAASRTSTAYDFSPFDIDRINTRESFRRTRSGTRGTLEDGRPAGSTRTFSFSSRRSGRQ